MNPSEFRAILEGSPEEEAAGYEVLAHERMKTAANVLRQSHRAKSGTNREFLRQLAFNSSQTATAWFARARNAVS